MTNEKLIAKIKAEIERLKAKYRKDMYKSNHEGLASGYKIEAYNELLPFLSTIESEKEQTDFPTTNEQVEEFLATHPKVEVPQKYKTPDWIFEKSEKPMEQEGLEEEIERLWESFADEMEGPHNLFDVYARLARHFAKWGAEHAREQMMKEAVEGVVCYGSKGAYIETDFLGEYDTDVYGNPGDKVRIIIVKEDEK